MDFLDTKCFVGKTVLITGTSHGIGRHLAIVLSDYGLQVIALARSSVKLDSLKKERPKINTVCIDITNFEDVNEKIVPLANNVDYLVLNASYYTLGHIDKISSDDFDSTFNTNVKAGLNLIKIVTVGMKERRYGCIVNISGRGTKTPHNQPFYNMSKAASERIKTHVVNELSAYNIRMTDVEPGIFHSDSAEPYLSKKELEPESLMIPLKRYSVDVEIVNTIVFLLSNSSKAINGTILYVDGGFHAL